jgi:hypothetical protein
MRISIQSKILILSLSCTLIGTLSLGILSTVFISQTTQRNSMQYMKDQASAEAAKLNYMFESHEKYTMAMAAGILSQINEDSTFLTNAEKHQGNIEGIQERLISTIYNLSGTKSVYVRFNPKITNASDGVLLVRDPQDDYFKPRTLNMSAGITSPFCRAVPFGSRPISTRITILTLFRTSFQCI